MSHSSLRSMCCALALFGSEMVHADLEQELQDVKTQRSQVEETHNQRLRECYQKFNVTDCRKEVMAAKAQALLPWVEKQRELQAQLRAEKANERRTQILEKQSAP